MGPYWDDYVRAGRSLDVLRPEQANQFGRFYPEWHGRPGVIDLPWAGRWPRKLPGKALALLAAEGVPTRLEDDRTTRLWWWVGGGAAAVSVLAAGLVAARRLL